MSDNATSIQAPEATLAETGTIVDNRRRRVGDFLREQIVVGSRLSIVSAYFTIYAYESLREALENAVGTRFLYGEPRGVGSMDPDEDKTKSFRLNEDRGIDLNNILTQKPLARACAAWIERQVEIRTVRQANFLHGKLYHIANKSRASAVLSGSSNFTRRGLGFGRSPNIELNIDVRDETDHDQLIRWFDELWNDETLTRDAKPDVLAALERLGRAYAPEFVYYKTLFHVFEDKLLERGAQDRLLQDINLYDTEIWKTLYEFQKDGATSAINRLLRHNGCIIADSVGLGKTWTALAVIKFFELRNERVLILCPKKLEDNWVRYASWANLRNNPFEKDRLNYTVLAHTDLSRYKGRSAQINLANFNWGAFDLIVIDESHNFRNEGRDRTDEVGNIVRRSRYNRLLEEVIKDGIRTKVLMLSATPVNTSLRDLRNQIYLMTEKRQNAFQETLRIGDIQTMFGVAQREFQQWETERSGNGKADKAALLQRLGADFLSLLDAVSIARSRAHISRFYPKVAEEIGGFPKRATPENLYPTADEEGELTYDDLHDRIGDFRLAVYMPSQYLKDPSVLEEEKKEHFFDQRDRERWLIGMLRVNLLKRLESSVHALMLTTERILKKMDDIDRLIEAWRVRGENGEFDSRPDEDEEDEEFVVGRGRQYRLDDLNVDRWQHDLREDRRVFRELHRLVRRVTPERDFKLAELKEVLRRKTERAPEDKDGHANRKALVFTTFADTARYLYDHLESWARDNLGVQIALITGGDGNRSTSGITGFVEILEQFAPVAQQGYGIDGKIDILIATDCLSEGQNLQDCDLVVNYDIHWNPVRLMQRFGRIDRLGSRNKQVSMINFWPTEDLDRYLNLKNRVEARMALANAAATGLDDPLEKDANTTAGTEGEWVHGELAFRDEQLIRLRDEILNFDEVDDGISMSDLTLDDFLADLLQYVQQNRAELEAAPFGIYAVAAADVAGNRKSARNDAPSDQQLHSFSPGAIFCLKQRTDTAERTPNVLQPYFLVYVREDGTVRYTFRQAKHSLTLFRQLAAGQPDVRVDLEDAFDEETEHGQYMDKYDGFIDAALRNIAGTFRAVELQQLKRDRGAKLTRKPKWPDPSKEFELITWFVIMDRKRAAGNGSDNDT